MSATLWLRKSHEPVSPLEIEQTYRTWNFSDAIGQCNLNPQGPLNLQYAISPNTEFRRVKEKDLSEKEKKALGIFQTPTIRTWRKNTKPLTIFGMAGLRNFIATASARGDYPMSIFDSRPDLLTPKSYGRLNNNSELYRYYRLSSVVNPITGKVYDNLNSVNWNPGGFHVERIRAGEHTRVFGGALATKSPEAQLWYYIVYGEKPNTIILEVAEVDYPKSSAAWRGTYRESSLKEEQPALSDGTGN
jgi:hypothetical protein